MATQIADTAQNIIAVGKCGAMTEFEVQVAPEEDVAKISATAKQDASIFDMFRTVSPEASANAAPVERSQFVHCEIRGWIGGVFRSCRSTWCM